MGRGRDRVPPRPDVEIGARVKAKRLRFGKRPEVKVEFEGAPETRSGSGSERSNLPHRVEPGVTYREVEVRWRAAARIVERGKRSAEAKDDDER